ncbi:MAG: dipeptide/oligopeptide/nickel ABC transporter ATP-binding protein [Peptostreptococcaceae bacterium]|nr:dipeptide/oligopeptide/nickel ABC transporter ATP-binding protein [Peptostreptococcaceae bacterium]
MKIEAKEVSKRYGKDLVLDKVSFVLEKGTCLALMGESGSGKSTMARLIAGLEKYDEGEILCDEVPYHKMDAAQEKKRKLNIQLVFQNALGAVNPNFSVYDVLIEPLIIGRSTLSKEAKREKAREMLELVGLEKIDLDQKARRLSGGQLQRVCIGRALMLEPEVLVLDESLSGLDPLVQRQMLKLLGDLKAKFDLTYIFIAHDFAACYYLCDKMIIMDQGRVIEELDDMDDLVIKSPTTKRLMGDAAHHLRYREEFETADA